MPTGPSGQEALQEFAINHVYWLGQRPQKIRLTWEAEGTWLVPPILISRDLLHPPGGGLQVIEGREAAVRAVTYIKGVTTIDNKISLSQPAPTSGTKAAVEAAMQRNVQLDAQKIAVDLSGPELTLRGDVRSWAQCRQAEHTAWNAAGVTTVRNELNVTS